MVSISLPRVLALLACVALLFGLLVLGGAGWPAAPDSGIDLADPETDPADHAGEHVETGGIVVATDPVVIEIEDEAGTERLPVENAPDVATGQELVVAGTLTDEGTLAADPERAVVREPWERGYMYAISLVGALLVALRIGNEWRFDPRRVLFEPRERTLLRRYRGEGRRDG